MKPYDLTLFALAAVFFIGCDDGANRTVAGPDNLSAIEAYEAEVKKANEAMAASEETPVPEAEPGTP